MTEGSIETVKEFVDTNFNVSTRKISSHMDMSHMIAWKIKKKDLGMHPYKPKKTQPLTQQHKDMRLAFCDWIEEKEPEFIDNVIWSDEKLWEEKVHPNKQNERYWAEADPETEVDCRVQGGRKVMCWAGIINGDIILHWFPAVRSVSTRCMYWFQQDGATAHCTNMVMNWLSSKFGQRIISRNADHPWPSSSPDLCPLN